MMSAPEKIIFLDIEATGLDPKRDYLLEVAAVAVDGRTLEELDSFSRVFPLDAVPERCDAYVFEMHVKNGLWDACLDVSDTDFDPEAPDLSKLMEFFARHEGAWLAGRNVAGFDKPWIEHLHPGICKPLHYRAIDMRTVISLGDFVPGLWGFDAKPGDSHRALDDARGDAEFLRRMVARLGLLVERFPGGKRRCVVNTIQAAVLLSLCTIVALAACVLLGVF